MQEQYKNNLRFKIFNTAKVYIDDFKYKINDIPEVQDKYNEKSILYFCLSKKIEKLEYEKIILELISLEISLKDIALICDVSLSTVEDIKKKNNIFFNNGKFKMNELEKELFNWENELKLEIAKRTFTSPRDVYLNRIMLGFSEYQSKKIQKINYYADNDEFNLRKSILEKFENTPVSARNVIEITGIDKFNLGLLFFNGKFNGYELLYYNGFAEHYFQNGDKELIWW